MTEMSSDRPQKSALFWRMTLSAVIIPLLLVLFYIDHQIGATAPVLLGLCLLLGCRCAWEICDLLQARSFRPHRLLVMACTGAVVASAWIMPVTSDTPDTMDFTAALGPTALAFGLCVIVLLLAGAARYRRPGSSMETLGGELVTVAYCGLLLAVTVQLRWVAGVEAGYLALGSMIIPTKFGDVGAYTFGRLFGKTKMAPLLSPGKTRAGAVGALVFSATAGWLWFRLGTPVFESHWQPPAAWLALLFGAAMGLSGLLGDLCESLMKRDVGRKDSAALLPGFGGMLDLLDSLLFAGPAAYLLWSLLPLATWR